VPSAVEQRAEGRSGFALHVREDVGVDFHRHAHLGVPELFADHWTG
jgi:hypothetical protein